MTYQCSAKDEETSKRQSEASSKSKKSEQVKDLDKTVNKYMDVARQTFDSEKYQEAAQEGPFLC